MKDIEITPPEDMLAELNAQIVQTLDSMRVHVLERGDVGMVAGEIRSLNFMMDRWRALRRRVDLSERRARA